MANKRCEASYYSRKVSYSGLTVHDEAAFTKVLCDGRGYLKCQTLRNDGIQPVWTLYSAASRIVLGTRQTTVRPERHECSPMGIDILSNRCVYCNSASLMIVAPSALKAAKIVWNFASITVHTMDEDITANGAYLRCLKTPKSTPRAFPQTGPRKEASTALCE